MLILIITCCCQSSRCSLYVRCDVSWVVCEWSVWSYWIFTGVALFDIVSAVQNSFANWLL